MISERDELLKGLRGMPVVLRQLVHGLSDDVVRRRPEPGEWAVVEVIAHLADTDQRTLARLHRMRSEESPELPGYDQAALAEERGYLSMPLERELARFEAIRAEQVALLESLHDAGWSRVGRHSDHGPITIQQLTAHSAGEDMDHLAQIARLIPA